MAHTITQEILELLKEHAETSRSLNPPKDDPEAGKTLLYKSGFTQAIEFFESTLNERRQHWEEGPNFEGFYSSVGDFMGTNALRTVGEVLFGIGWEDDYDYNDDDAIQSICDKLYPHRYMVQCLDLGEKDIQVLEIGI